MERHRLDFLPFCVALLYLLFSHVDISSSQNLKSFGEACDADCDERQLLTCAQNTSVCECMHKSMVYDTDQQKCVGRAGYPCVRYASDLHCLPHSHCDRTSKTCICDKGYYETENGTACSLLAKYGDVCSAKRPCDRNSGMSCMEKSGSGNTRAKKTCSCTFPRDQFYNSTQKACISFAGGNCSFSWPCVHGAECSVDIYEQRKGENIHGRSYTYNVTVGRKCACQEGTTQTRGRQCLRTYRQPCDTSDDRGDGGCNTEENLKCFDSSICLCSNPLSQIFDVALQKCVNLVGAKCTAPRRSRRKEAEDDAAQADRTGDDGNGVVCTSHAECSAQNGCQCQTSYSSTPFSTCLKDYGAECSNTEESPCNYYRGLSCFHTSGTCGCIENLKYDGASQSCLSMEVGGPCGRFEYSDRSGFILGGVGKITMANHNREEVMTAHGTASKRSSIIANGNGNGNHNQTASILPGVLVSTRIEKVLQSLAAYTYGEHNTRRIQIECGDGLECVNSFGNTLIRKTGGREACDNDISQGFCRR